MGKRLLPVTNQDSSRITSHAGRQQDRRPFSFFKLLAWTLFAIIPYALPAFPQNTTAATAGGVIHGVVKSGSQPLPGVTVTAANTLTGQKVSTSSDLDGTYALRVSSTGRYVVRAQMAAFAVATQEVRITPELATVQADLDLVLLSRAPKQPTEQQVAAAMGIPSGAGNTSGQSGFQSMSLMQGDGADGWQGGGDQSNAGAAAALPGMSDTAATESVSVSGNTSNPFGNMSSAEMQQRFEEIRQQYGRGIPGGAGGGFGSAFGGGFGGFGGGPFILGGGGGGRGRGRFNINQPHGSLYYDVQDGALNASPFSVTGQPTSKPDFISHRFGASLGGPLNIPKIYNGGTKTFFFANYNGSRGETPFDEFSTVPTLAERAGNFNGVATVVDPSTGIPFTNDTLPQINPAAQGLLQFIPIPNLPGATQNFHFVTATDSSSDDLNVRLNRTLGATPAGPRRGRGRGPRNSLSFGLRYHHTESNLTNAFPGLGGTSSVQAWDVPVSYTRSFGKITNIVRFDFNRNRSQTQNLFAFSQDVTGNLGIQGVSQNPFDWGVPNLSFSDIAGLSDVSPSRIVNQTLTFSDSMIWTHGKHTFAWGGDYRRLQVNNESDSNPRGSFIFTGAFSGYDFADFLLGLPQQTSVQYGATPGSTRSYHFRGNSWDLYAQDTWRMRGNLTLNLGVRYEYVSPYSETNNQLVNLFVPANFNPAISPAPVFSGQSGVPATIIKPDRNNFAPRLGLAWKPFSKTVVRAGYGINYNLGEYQGMAQNLAFQPPFATAQTNLASSSPAPLTLQNGFPAPVTGQITNNFAVDPNYRLGYVQMWDLDIQQELRPTLVMNLDYTGSKGTALDILEAPNRLLGQNTSCTDSSLVWCNVAPFYLESSQGDSILHAGSLSIRKRLQNGISIGGTYTYSKSLDNASSIGNGIVISTGGFGGGGFGGGRGGTVLSGSTSVAQDPLNLAAERGLSSFNQTHRFTANYLWELPIGKDKRWLGNGGVFASILGDWQWSGDWTIASGLPFTPVIVGSEAEVNGGTSGTLRLDVNGPVTLGSPIVTAKGIQWFNTGAFSPPAPGQYGDAGRNSIIGPGSISFDMAMTKVFPMAEGRMLEFRISSSNVFNHPNFSTIDTNFNSPTFGFVTGAGSMRSVQLQARFRF